MWLLCLSPEKVVPVFYFLRLIPRAVPRQACDTRREAPRRANQISRPARRRGGGKFAIFSLWLPELFGTKARATAFAFCTSVGCFIGAGVNFGLAGAVAGMGTLGTLIALTAIAFGVGLLVIRFARETRGQTLPD
jgi:hypothetical protein